jgi:hypothetical protein
MRERFCGNANFFIRARFQAGSLSGRYIRAFADGFEAAAREISSARIKRVIYSTKVKAGFLSAHETFLLIFM